MADNFRHISLKHHSTHHYLIQNVMNLIMGVRKWRRSDHALGRRGRLDPARKRSQIDDPKTLQKPAWYQESMNLGWQINLNQIQNAKFTLRWVDTKHEVKGSVVTIDQLRIISANQSIFDESPLKTYSNLPPSRKLQTVSGRLEINWKHSRTICCCKSSF